MLFLFCFLSFSAMTGYKYYSFHRDIFCGSCRQFGRFSFLSGRDFCFVRLCFLFLRIFFSFCWDNFCAFSGKFVRNFYSICRFFYQPFRYFSVPGAFFCLFCVGICRVFPVILIFHPESFTFCGCRLSFFYRLFRHFSVLGAFFCLFCAGACCVFFRNLDFSSGIFRVLWVLPAVFSSHSRIFCASPEFFSKEKPTIFGFRFPFSGIFPSPFESFSSFFPCSVGNFSLHIHNFSTFLRTFRREFISHSGIFRFPNHFFCQSCAGSCRVFPPSSRFFSGIFCVLRMLLAVFFISHSGIFRFPEHFFLPVLCRRPPCFFSVIPIFI